MAGGLNDLELETETLDEVCLSPLPAARRRPVKPTQGELTPAITRRRLRGGGGASWWARLLRRLRRGARKSGLV